MSQPPARYTLDQFLALPGAGHHELRDGELVPLPASEDSARIASHLQRLLAGHAHGRIFDTSLPIQPWPDAPNRILRADFGFISEDRLEDVIPGSPVLAIPPDLVGEIVDPASTAAAIEARVSEYLQAGVSLLWLIYPATRHVYVFRGDGTVTALWPGDTLSGEQILPGFAIPVVEIFAAAG